MIFFFCIAVRTIPKMERYCSCVLKFIGFRTSHEKGFLVFDVPNVVVGTSYLWSTVEAVWTGPIAQ